MNKYELVYVIDTTLDDDARKAVMDRFHGMLESLGGKVEKVEEVTTILPLVKTMLLNMLNRVL